MNYFVKRVAILKQISHGYSTAKPVSGIVKIEKCGADMYINWTVQNLARVDEGEYKVIICASDKKLCPYDYLSASQTVPVENDLPEIEDGFSVVLAYFNKSVSVPVAYADSGKNTASAEDIIKDYKYPALNLKIKPESAFKAEPEVKEVNTAVPESEKTVYEDEIVATENYYEFENKEKEKELIMDIPQENKNDESENRNQDEYNVREQINGAAVSSKIEETEKESAAQAAENEEPYDFKRKFQEPKSFKSDYFEKVRVEIERIMTTYETEEYLTNNIPDSRFVKINYEGDKYYVVGIITVKGEVAYICYGVPSRSDKGVPEELKGYASYFPKNLFGKNGEGYYIMYQDAKTGESIRL